MNITKEEIRAALLSLDTLAARLDELDGMYCWLDEIKEVREVLEKVDNAPLA